MDLYTLCVWLPFLLLLPLISQFIRNKRGVIRSRPPPSPSRIYIIARMFGNLLHRSLTQLSKKHGPVMLLQLGSVPVLVVPSAEVTREVLKTHDHVFCNRPVLEGFRKHLYNFKDVALSTNGEYWRQMRKISVLELLSAKNVHSFRSVRVQEVENMIKSISLASSCVVNLNEKINLLLHTVILRITLGTSYEGKEFESGGNLSELLHGAIAMMGTFSVLSLFPYVGRVIALFTGLQQKLDKNFNELDTLLQQAVDEHSDPDRHTGEYEDIVDVLLRLEKEQFGEIHLTKDHIKAIIMIQVVPYLYGQCTMSELVKNLKVMKKVQEEVRRCVGKKEKVDENDLDQLHFLKMVIKESLRIHSPGSVLIPRECMSHYIIDGYDIYPKTWVLINIWAIARDPVSWKNPEEFLPERAEYSVGHHNNFSGYGTEGEWRSGIDISGETEVVLSEQHRSIRCYNCVPLALVVPKGGSSSKRRHKDRVTGESDGEEIEGGEGRGHEGSVEPSRDEREEGEQSDNSESLTGLRGAACSVLAQEKARLD
ncbi:hypothetical protein GIB67_025014 [Kingdonia uniflora]|uniref:Cytochrome P450 n=1 Tax=Kingdonia uniflora TaxID=39325 RepID=A0A7J7N807_9MAGN|nr:hypothetical protein GIB67_025014 [Kingdonia uniflora]